MPRRQPRKPDLQPPTAQEKKLTGLENELATAKDELRRLRAEKKAADEQNQQLLEKLERERNAGRSVKVPTKGRKRSSKRATLRVFVPDSHGASVDVAAQQAFLADLEFLNPDEFIWIGDHLDCGGFLAQHHTLGYVPETAYTHEEDIAAANAFLDAVQTQCPKSGHVYIHGNHEARLEKWCIQQALGKQADAEYLMRLHSVEATLHLKQRGIREVEYGKKYDGLRVPGAIKLGRGKAIATHGSSCGVNACRDMLKKWGKSVFFGHIHRLLAYRDSDAVSTRGSWAVGLLAIPQPYYQNTKPTGHTQGYTVQLEHPDGEFMVIQVPIIDGVSYLGPLKGRLG